MFSWELICLSLLLTALRASDLEFTYRPYAFAIGNNPRQTLLEQPTFKVLSQTLTNQHIGLQIETSVRLVEALSETADVVSLLSPLSEFMEGLLQHVSTPSNEEETPPQPVIVPANGRIHTEDGSAIFFPHLDSFPMLQGLLTMAVTLPSQQLLPFLLQTLSQDNAYYFYETKHAQNLLKILNNIEKRHANLSDNGKALVLFLASFMRFAFDPNLQQPFSSVYAMIWPIAPTKGFGNMFLALRQEDKAYIQSQTILPHGLSHVLQQESERMARGLLSVVLTAASSSRFRMGHGKGFGNVHQDTLPGECGFPISLPDYFRQLAQGNDCFAISPNDQVEEGMIKVVIKGIPRVELGDFAGFVGGSAMFLKDFLSSTSGNTAMSLLRIHVETPRDLHLLSDNQLGAAAARRRDFFASQEDAEDEFEGGDPPPPLELVGETDSDTPLPPQTNLVRNQGMLRTGIAVVVKPILFTMFILFLLQHYAFAIAQETLVRPHFENPALTLPVPQFGIPVHTAYLRRLTDQPSEDLVEGLSLNPTQTELLYFTGQAVVSDSSLQLSAQAADLQDHQPMISSQIYVENDEFMLQFLDAEANIVDYVKENIMFAFQKNAESSEVYEGLFHLFFLQKTLVSIFEGDILKTQDAVKDILTIVQKKFLERQERFANTDDESDLDPALISGRRQQELMDLMSAILQTHLEMYFTDVQVNEKMSLVTDALQTQTAVFRTRMLEMKKAFQSNELVEWINSLIADVDVSDQPVLINVDWNSVITAHRKPQT